jgi:hypothetical protein
MSPQGPAGASSARRGWGYVIGGFACHTQLFREFVLSVVGTRVAELVIATSATPFSLRWHGAPVTVTCSCSVRTAVRACVAWMSRRTVRSNLQARTGGPPTSRPTPALSLTGWASEGGLGAPPPVVRVWAGCRSGNGPVSARRPIRSHRHGARPTRPQVSLSHEVRGAAPPWARSTGRLVALRVLLQLVPILMAAQKWQRASPGVVHPELTPGDYCRRASPPVSLRPVYGLRTVTASEGKSHRCHSAPLHFTQRLFAAPESPPVMVETDSRSGPEWFPVSPR